MQGFMDCRAGTGSRRYTLRFSFNAFAAFEAETTRPSFAVIGEMEAGRLQMAGDLRALCWAAMITHHPNATLDDAGNLLDVDPSCVHRALSIALPDAGTEDGTPAKKRMARFRSFATFFALGWRWGIRSRGSGI